MNQILKSYLYCILFTEFEEVGEYDINDFSAAAIEKSKKDIDLFLAETTGLLDDWSEDQIGLDFWYTRNGHGVGFWDRDLPNGDKLTEICEKNYRFYDSVWVNESGKIEID